MKRNTAAARIRTARGWADLNQDELAVRMGVSTATLRRIEQGQRDATETELAEIADWCDVPREFMLRGWKGLK